MGPGVEIDTVDTRELVLGEDIQLIANITNCPNNPSVVVRAGEAEIVSYATLPVVTITHTDLGIERQVIQVIVPAANMPVSTFGLPAQADIVMEIECDTGRGVSAPITVGHIPTSHSFVPAFNPRKFWPSDVEGEYIVCDGTDLIHVAQDSTVTDLNLGFSCALGELTGTLGFRRYLVAEDTGIAAVDPGPVSSNIPVIAWSQTFFVRGTATDPTRDPVVIERIGGQRQMYILDRDSGRPTAGPILFDRIPLGDGTRDPNDNILILESERDGTNSLTYFVHRYDPAGADLGSTQIAFYPFNASAFIARFSPTGDSIYVTVAPVSEEEMWVEKLNITNCLPSCPVSWSTQGMGPWFVPLGEQSGRTLIATEEELQWVDPSTGSLIGQSFTTDSGAGFLRAAVENDGSIVVLGEHVGTVAQAMYIFRPDGTRQLRIGGTEVLFRWLVPAWNGSIIVSYMDGIHQLLPRQIYDDLIGPP